MRPLTWRVLIALAVFLAAVLPYASSVKNGFVYDDVVAVRDNARVHGLGAAGEILTTEYWNRRELPSRLYRPLTLLSIAAESAMLGPAPGHFHVVNAILHGLASLGVTLLAFWCLRPRARSDMTEEEEEAHAREERSSLFAAGAAGLLFAMHSLHSEAVLAIVGRAELLSALFTLIALCALFHGGRARWIAPIAALFALLAKESAALLVPYAVVLALFGFSRAAKRTAMSSSRVREALTNLVWIAPGFLLAMLLRWNAIGKIAAPTLAYADNPLVSAGPIDRVMTSSFLFARYFILHLLPEPLSPDYSIRSIPIVHLGDLGSALGLGIWGFFALAIWFSYRMSVLESDPSVRRGWSMAGLGFSWFAIGTLLSSNLFFLIGTIFAERLSYLPGVGLFLIFAAIFKGALELRAALPQFAAVSFVVALLIGGTLGEIRPLAGRTAAWKSNLTLFKQATRDQPESFRVWTGYGEALMNEGRFTDAEAALQKSLAIYPDFGATHNCLMSIYHDQGKNDLAVKHARELNRLVPVDARPYFVLSEASRAAGDARQAAAEAEAGLALDAGYLPLHLAAGRAYEALGQHEAAAAEFRRVIDAQPELISAKNELAPVLVKLERWEEAIALYRAILVQQKDWVSQNGLAWSLLQWAKDDPAQSTGRLDEALQSAEASVASAPAEMRRYPLDTMAAIRWARGEKAAAVSLAQELAAAYPAESSYRESLAKYRAGM